MTISGIYKIQSKIKPERIYIGSALNIKARWSHHKSTLKLNSHSNNKLQNHYNKYGESDLCFTIILECEKTELADTEQFFIDSYKPWFNISPSAYSCRGIKLSDETKQKISNAIKGRRLSDEHKKRIGLANKGKGIGRIMSEETRNKKRISMIGKNVGKVYSEEERRKMSERSIGRVFSEEHKRNISKGNTGRIFTPETRLKISLKHKGKKKNYAPWNKGKKGVYSADVLYKMGAGNRGKIRKVA